MSAAPGQPRMEEAHTPGALIKRRKNADAQAAFRARRQSYIKSLEHTILRLHDGITVLQNICKSATAEVRRLRERSASQQRLVDSLTAQLQAQSNLGTCPACRHCGFQPAEACDIAPTSYQPTPSTVAAPQSSVDLDTWAKQAGRIAALVEDHDPPVHGSDLAAADLAPFPQISHAHNSGTHASTSSTTLEHLSLESTSRLAASTQTSDYTGAPFEFAAFGFMMHPGRPFQTALDSDIPGAMNTLGRRDSSPDLSSFTPRLWSHQEESPNQLQTSTFANAEPYYRQEKIMLPSFSTGPFHYDSCNSSNVQPQEESYRSLMNKRSWGSSDAQLGAVPIPLAQRSKTDSHEVQVAKPEHAPALDTELTVRHAEAEQSDLDPTAELTVSRSTSSTRHRRMIRNVRLSLSDPIAACSSSGSSKVNGLPAKVARCQKTLANVQDVLSKVKEEAYQALQHPHDLEPRMKWARTDDTIPRAVA